MRTRQCGNKRCGLFAPFRLYPSTLTLLVPCSPQILSMGAQSLALLDACFDAVLLPDLYIKRHEDLVDDFRVFVDELMGSTKSAFSMYVR